MRQERRGVRATVPAYRISAAILVALSVWVVPVQQARSGSDVSAIARKLSPNIHRVIAGGYWSQGKKEGFFRVVVVAGGVEQVSHRLYLQWIEVNPADQTYRVVRTRGIKEINGGRGYLLTIKAQFPGLKTLRLSVVARRERSPKKVRFVITAKGDGSFATRKATK